VQNVVPVERAVAERSLQGRADAYAEEVRRLIDAAYTVMRETGAIDPRVSDIVASAALSNQAFYRHFRGKDELFLAVLEDGQRRLVDSLNRHMDPLPAGAARVRAWVEVILEQARNPDAAANTRPFALNSARLANQFPAETERQRERVIVPLRAAVADVGGDPQSDADAIYHLAMGRMQDALVRHEVPSRHEVEQLCSFALRALGVG
jgi:AcrR family transcriptional regulator